MKDQYQQTFCLDYWKRY